MLAMMHCARLYLLTVKALDPLNLGLLFDNDFSDPALLKITIPTPRNDMRMQKLVIRCT
jgi:hypothetical protein